MADTIQGVSDLIHKPKGLEGHHAGGRAVCKEQVRHFKQTLLGLQDVRLYLRLQAGALVDDHPFQPVLGPGNCFTLPETQGHRTLFAAAMPPSDKGAARGPILPRILGASKDNKKACPRVPDTLWHGPGCPRLPLFRQAS